MYLIAVRGLGSFSSLMLLFWSQSLWEIFSKLILVEKDTRKMHCRYVCKIIRGLLTLGPEDNFCSTKISKDSALAKLSDFM